MENSILVDTQFIDKIIELTKKAERSIWVCAYDWRWYEHQPEEKIQQFNSAVFLAKSRGVDVRVLCDKPSTKRNLQFYGIKAKCVDTTRTLHAKAIMIDTKALIIGSHNLTIRGSVTNLELSLLSTNLETILQFQRFFDTLYTNILS